MNDYDVKNERTLVEQQQALSSYLDALFREMPAVQEEPPAEVVAPVQAPVQAKVVETQPVEVKTALQPEPEIILPQPVMVEEEVVSPEVEVVVEQVPPVIPEIYMPSGSFQVLFFQIGKLKLAVPLEKLAGILKNDDLTITAIPGYADWQMGLTKVQGVTINLLDTAKLVVPANRQDVVVDRRKYRYFILIGDKRWGLGCHSVADVVTLSPDEVKWRPNRSSQPWLAGTVIERMCAMLDVEGFIKMLHQQHK